MTDYERCPELVDSRSRIVNGVGPDDADLLFLGEVPGARESESGEPFMGHSGSVLDNVLREAGLTRADVHTTNCMRCRPPDSRDPTGGRLSDYRSHFAREFEFVDPEPVVTLGKVPSQCLLDHGVIITNESGSIVDARAGSASYRVLLSVHPVAALYDRDQRGGFFETIAHAIDLSGLADPAGGQANLGDFWAWRGWPAKRWDVTSWWQSTATTWATL